MNAIKTLLAVSVLAATGAANAAIWDVSANGSETYAASGALSVVYTGTWDDVTGEGSLSGVAHIAAYNLDANVAQTFKMTPATGKGVLRQMSSPTGSCTDTIGGGVCAGMVPVFKGALANSISYAGGANNTVIGGTPFTAAAGSYVWSFLALYDEQTDPDTGESLKFYSPYHLNVTLSAPAPAVPVPAAAWLFGSGLLGLAGAARRRRG